MTNQPKISVNEIAKYMAATSGQRKRIVANQKRPKTFMVNYYDFARTAIVDFIANSQPSTASLQSEIERLYSADADNDYNEHRNRNNAEAIESFLDSFDQLGFDVEQLAIAPADSPKVRIGGVDISVRPEILIKGDHRGSRRCGALKLYISKENQLDGLTAPYIAALVLRHAQDNPIDGPAAPFPKWCLVLDVFSGELHSVPSGIVRRLADLEAACEEIALRWQSL